VILIDTWAWSFGLGASGSFELVSVAKKLAPRQVHAKEPNK
jgi:hypothetical protein